MLFAIWDSFLSWSWCSGTSRKTRMEGFRARKNVPMRLHVSDVVYLPSVGTSASVRLERAKTFLTHFWVSESHLG